MREPGSPPESPGARLPGAQSAPISDERRGRNGSPGQAAPLFAQRPPQAPSGIAAIILSAARAAHEALGTAGLSLTFGLILAGAAVPILTLRRDPRSGREGAAGKRAGPSSGDGAGRERLRQDIKERRKQELVKEAKARRAKENSRAVNDAWMRMDRERLARLAAEEIKRQREQAEEQRRRAERMRRSGKAKDRQWALSILGLDASASQAQIRNAYIAGMKANHPDQASTASPDVQAIFSERAKLLNIANDILNGKSA